MTTWRGRTDDGTFAVEFQPSVLSALDRFCHDAGSSETGGILVGRYSDDLSLAIVGEVTPPPPDSKRGRSWFVRGVNGLRELLGKRWRANDRTFYLGEWHFHPVNHVEPSGDDFAQMLEISHKREYDCKEPLLVILGAGKREGQRIFRAFVCPAENAPMELHGAKEENAVNATGEGALPSTFTKTSSRGSEHLDRKSVRKITSSNAELGELAADSVCFMKGVGVGVDGLPAEARLLGRHP